MRSKTTYYWLDRVAPAWSPGQANVFTWPTAPVLRQTSVKPGDLGVVVRLDRKESGNPERVAPAVFHRDAGAKAANVKGYRFTLRTNGPAKIRCRVFPASDDTVLDERPWNREKPGSPFTVRWRPGERPEGWYRLVVDGWIESNNAALYKEVHFFHKKRLEPPS